MFPLGAVAVILSLGALFLPSAVGLAAPTAKPDNTSEPTISGQAEQGHTLSASRGSWTACVGLGKSVVGCAAGLREDAPTHRTAGRSPARRGPAMSS